MSDVSGGPGWWQASDLKWYPPESHPDAVAVAPPDPVSTWGAPDAAALAADSAASTWGAPVASSAATNSAAARGLRCGKCGASPAARVKFTKQTGMIFVNRRSWSEGNLCRSCGLATSKDVLNHNLVAGWWGLLSIILMPFTLAGNARSTKAIKALPNH